MNKSLKTQDRLRPWDVGGRVNIGDLLCPLCKQVRDSQAHLFFSCSFASRVWNKIKVLAGMDNIPADWDSIIASLMPLAHRNLFHSVLGRLVFGATAYVVWQERNLRVYNKSRRSSI